MDVKTKLRRGALIGGAEEVTTSAGLPHLAVQAASSRAVREGVTR